MKFLSQAVALVSLAALIEPGMWACSQEPGGPGAKPSPPTMPLYPSDPILPSDAPVLIPGSAGVTDGGQPTYSIPLRVPDGANGMSPSLGLAYGGTANGRLGVGWNVSGLSAIMPCRKTFSSEGLADGPDFDRADSYCLDGQTLVEETAVGLERKYRTESESFSWITAIYPDNQAPQPDRFIVENRNGTISSYEPLSAPRLKGTGGEDDIHVQSPIAIIYPIRRAVDRTGGNEIRYHYEMQTDTVPGLNEFSYRIAEIGWSFDSHGVARRRMRFVYEGPQLRPDPVIMYDSGVRIANRFRLIAIEAHAPNPYLRQLVWSYHFQYQVRGMSR
jgi:hypothetical protein